MGSVGANRASGGSTAVNYNTPEYITAARNSLKGITSGKRFQSATITRPTDGHEVEISVEKVTTRDYWGRSTGRQTYTVYAWDNSVRNEYGNRERLWYNYGVEKLSQVKDELRRVLGISGR